MKVLGFTDEICTCDCCGKRNLKGTFAIEADGGEVLHYGSVCVGKVYGKRAAADIISRGKHIAQAQAMTWEKALDATARGMLGNLHAFIGEKAAWNNSNTLLAQADTIRDLRSGIIVKRK